MHKRLAQQRLTELLVQFAVVALRDPHQTGMTTLAFAQKQNRPNARYLDLHSAQRQLDDPQAFFMAHPNQLVFLDVVQRMPGVFSILRGVIDQRRRKQRPISATGVSFRRVAAKVW